MELKSGAIVDCKGYQCIAQGQCSEVCEDQTQCAEGYRCEKHRCEPIPGRKDAGTDSGNGAVDAGAGDAGDGAAQPDPAKRPQPSDDGCATAPGPRDWRGTALFALAIAWLSARRQNHRGEGRKTRLRSASSQASSRHDQT